MKDGYRIAVRPDEAMLDFGVAATCFLERAWESHTSDLIGSILKPGDLAIDIGANIGTFSCRMSTLVGAEGQIIAFEPSRRTFKQLQASIHCNGASNIMARNLALGAHRGTLELRVPVKISANASVFSRAGEGEVQIESVELSTLDDELDPLHIKSLSLIKLDAEGAELDILRGAERTLSRHRPRLLVEWNPETAALAGWTLHDLLSFMEKCGSYKSSLVWRGGKLLTVDLKGIEIEPGGYVDLLFEPTPTAP